MKKDKVKDAFLEQLRKVPIIQVACEKVGISRNSVYRWKNDDPEFEKELTTALEEGEALVNDMSENQLLVLIREKNWHAISFWLRKRNPKFKDKIEVEVKPKQEEITPEQEATVREALRFAGTLPNENTNESDTSAEHGGDDAEGSESTNGNH